MCSVCVGMRWERCGSALAGWRAGVDVDVSVVHCLWSPTTFSLSGCTHAHTLKPTWWLHRPPTFQQIMTRLSMCCANGMLRSVWLIVGFGGADCSGQSALATSTDRQLCVLRFCAEALHTRTHTHPSHHQGRVPTEILTRARHTRAALRPNRRLTHRVFRRYIALAHLAVHLVDQSSKTLWGGCIPSPGSNFEPSESLENASLRGSSSQPSLK
jgi:hypothetical protein